MFNEDDSSSSDDNEITHTHVMNSMQFHMEEENYLKDIEIISEGDKCESIIFIA